MSQKVKCGMLLLISKIYMYTYIRMFVYTQTYVYTNTHIYNQYVSEEVIMRGWKGEQIGKI